MVPLKVRRLTSGHRRGPHRPSRLAADKVLRRDAECGGGEALAIEGQEHVIMQAEVLPQLVARIVWASRLRNRRCISFIDNDAARHALIRGDSSHAVSAVMVQETWSMDTEGGTTTWYERVPSASNISDEPSRGACAELQAMGAVMDSASVPACRGAGAEFGCIRGSM